MDWNQIQPYARVTPAQGRISSRLSDLCHSGFILEIKFYAIVQRFSKYFGLRSTNCHFKDFMVHWYTTAYFLRTRGVFMEGFWGVKTHSFWEFLFNLLWFLKKKIPRPPNFPIHTKEFNPSLDKCLDTPLFENHCCIFSIFNCLFITIPNVNALINQFFIFFTF